MHAADLGPVPASERTQSPLDLFLIFAGANIVATTLQVGASLSASLPWRHALGVIAVGGIFGAALVAALAPAGTRLGVPSIVATRAVLGLRGAALVAGLLYLTNFAWIALNNVIAASVVARGMGWRMDERSCALALGLLATVIVSLGPRAVGRADRVAVPLMFVAGALVTAASLRLPWSEPVLPASGSTDWLRGFDVVVGYQVSWLLMFADYPRYTSDPRRGGVAVFLGLALSALWFMPLGFAASLLAGSTEPGAMVAATGLGRWGALLMALATVTTNFVNIYMSALAWKSLWPGTGDQAAIWSIGVIGTVLSVFSTAWLDGFAGFMLVLGGMLVPIGGILFAHFVVRRRLPQVVDLYRNPGPYTDSGGFVHAGMIAWALGTATYFLTGAVGATLPTLAVAIVAYLVLDRLFELKP